MYLPVLPWDDLRHLPLPDLAMALLKKQAASSQINLNNVLRGMDMALGDAPQPDGPTLQARVADAWAWLESHALVGVHHLHTPSGNTQRVTELGQQIVDDPAAVSKLWAAERLAGPIDPRLESARSNLALGDYETASFAALKAVEVEVRRVSGLSNDLVGVGLARQAFKPQTGPLTDPGAEGGEQQATADLFAGAMGTFKNPASHRTVRFDDAVEAAEVVQLADLLLRIVDRAEGRRRRSTSEQ